MYGTEAINTIVQEMENRREDTIVILAGYPEEMNELLDITMQVCGELGIDMREEWY